jgi:hypothetical protein
MKFMEDWTPWNWIAFRSIGVAAILILIETAAKEGTVLSTWLPSSIKIYVLGYGPAVFFMIATIIIIIQGLKGKKSVEVGKPTPVIQTPAPAMPPSSMLAKPKKFYSDREKSDLADALRDLSEILNKDGPNIKQKAQRIIEEWRPMGMQDIAKKPPDIGATIDQLNEVGNLAATLYRDLFEDNGFIKKHQTYDDELCQILQVHKNPSNTSNQPLIELQSEINYFRNMLTPIKLAEKYNDKNLNTLMITNTSVPFNNFQHKINVFRTWIDDTKKHIAAFRHSQLN